MVVFSFVSPQAFSDNEFCNIQENLKIQEELVKDNPVLIEFLKVLPSAELTRANFVQWSNPEQTSMTWTAGVYSLDIHIWGFDTDNPSDCFVPGGYRLNAPHLPEMTGSNYHKDPKIVLEQIEDLEPKYVKGGPAPPQEPEPFTEQFYEKDRERYCAYAVERGLPTPWKYDCYERPAQNPQRAIDFENPLLESPVLGYDLKDCNDDDNASLCFYNAFDSCTPAKIQQSKTTVEGDPVYLGAYITDDCKIHVISDNREDKWSSLADRKIIESECSTIQFKDNAMMISNCNDLNGFTFSTNGNDLQPSYSMQWITKISVVGIILGVMSAGIIIAIKLWKK